AISRMEKQKSCSKGISSGTGWKNLARIAKAFKTETKILFIKNGPTKITLKALRYTKDWRLRKKSMKRPPSMLLPGDSSRFWEKTWNHLLNAAIIKTI